jgi:hypothetical protein
VTISATATRSPWRTPLAGAPLAAVLLAAWLLVAPRTPDLAAQLYRVEVFRQVGLAVWDVRWYAGHHLPGYSLLFPPLGSLLGVRLVGVLSVLASSVMFERIALAVYGPTARWGAAFFAVAAVGDVWSGRVTFALGVSFALAAVLAMLRGRPRWAGVLAGACACASPVAGAMLALAGLTHAIARNSPRSLLALGAPPAAVVAALTLLFPEGGVEPYAFPGFLVTALVALVFLWCLAPEDRLLRVGAALYMLVSLLSALVNTPMGSNVERYGVLLAGPLLLCARLAPPRRPASGGPVRWRGSASALGLALGAIALWVVWGPVRETVAIAGNESTSAAYYQPVKSFLAQHADGPVRIEVPLTRSHWEAALLAPTVSLARGWEKQLDVRFDDVLLEPGLTPAGYDRWLHTEAVRYVALPDTTLDPSSAEEGQLIRAGLPFLQEVFASRHWRIYAVRSPTPLAEGPGRLTALTHDSFALHAEAAGSFLVRVRYTRYWTITSGAGCVGQAPGGWTSVSVRAPGSVVVAARFSLARALDLAGSCQGSPVAVAGAPARAAVASSYRWLVGTAGAAPSIAAENRAVGTASWRLPGPASLIAGAANGPVEGYVAAQAVAAGQAESVYVNAPGARTVTMQVYRMGWYGGLGGRLVLQSGALAVVRQPPCTHRSFTGLTECRWHPTLTFTIPPALPSGVYIVKLRSSTGAQRDCLFVVRSTKPAPLLVEIPTASYEAYNAWGGDSLYRGGSEHVGATGGTRGVEVSYDRPYDSQTGAGQFFVREVAMVRFLERYGYPLSYTTIESIDRDPGQLAGARAVIDVGHSEYWSARAERAFAQARDRGTSLIFISSDTMAWLARFGTATAHSSQAGQPDHRIVAYGESAGADPERRRPTGPFPLGGAQLTGSAYDGCITPRINRPGPPSYGYYAWSPTRALRPSWLFAHTGITPATRIPGIVGYELDARTAATPRGTLLVGRGAAESCMPGGQSASARGAVAETTLYTARSGALVFATGTLGWEYALSPVPQASSETPARPDGRVVAMTRNLLSRVLSRRR